MSKSYKKKRMIHGAAYLVMSTRVKMKDTITRSIASKNGNEKENTDWDFVPREMWEEGISLWSIYQSC
jgi:hypothetical protein